MKRVAILGSTGSIGVNALDVIKDHPSQFAVLSLSAGRNIDLLREQISRFRPKVVAVIDEEHARKLRLSLNPSRETTVLFGQDGYSEVAALKEADIVLSAMVGSAGLIPTMAAIEAGKDVALANKETLVMAGRLVVERAAEKGVKILPVDSEHSAVFQCLDGHRREDIKRIILTASGGPFLNVSRDDLLSVTPAQALKHPNWDMGRKITVDSASLMNKGLEVIEARWLFDVDIDHIHVLIHPQSIVHSLVEFKDGSVLAQLGLPDMRGPIAYALSYPARIWRPPVSLDLLKVGNLAFMPPDAERFPSLALAYQAGKQGGTMPAVMNAANELAVQAFLEERVGFMDMPKIIEQVLAAHSYKAVDAIADVLEADRWAREEAIKVMEGWMT